MRCQRAERYLGRQSIARQIGQRNRQWVGPKNLGAAIGAEHAQWPFMFCADQTREQIERIGACPLQIVQY